ncbi:hypothetical protein CDAR_383591 [Caerostris darwini]|uniref:Uncharacterized protein n=1 Tax=Caerostris darwini TaxID=1538125 RepID=A0AAV4Q928_9ARAC|nr:hypothetical protein CDAR_383591 [Caerostris darwini]
MQARNKVLCDGRYCFSPHTIDRIVIETRHGALKEGIKNAQPPSMSVVRVRVGVMEIDLRNDVPPTFHVYLCLDGIISGSSTLRKIA